MHPQIENHKISSEAPLGFFNKFIYTDFLHLGSGYQFDEIKFNKVIVKLKSYDLWGPETSHKYVDFYENGVEVKTGSIGYYSTASWVRAKFGHIDQGFQMQKNEIELKMLLADFVRQNNLKIKIFLHPKEKVQSLRKDTETHYEEIFGKKHFEFANWNINSASTFHQVDLGISFYSTIVFERLFFGFKTLLFTKYSNDFPLINSSINNICPKTEKELIAKINESLSLSNKEFFIKNMITQYVNENLVV